MMVDPLMEAMAQSGIIESHITPTPVTQIPIKMSTVLLPKRIISRSASLKRSYLTVKSELPSKGVNTYFQAESLSSGKRVKLNNNEGPVKPYSQLKPANYELRAPVLRHIFSGTFHSAAFNVQVRPELS